MSAREAIKWSGGPFSVPLSGHLAHRTGDLEIDIAEDMEREFRPNRKDKSMAMTEAYDRDPRKGAAVGIVNETPFTRLSGAVERLRKAHSIVGSVCANLVGEHPPEATAAGKRANGSGLLGNVEEMSDSVTGLADEIIEYAERIARRL